MAAPDRRRQLIKRQEIEHGRVVHEDVDRARLHRDVVDQSAARGVVANVDRPHASHAAGGLYQVGGRLQLADGSGADPDRRAGLRQAHRDRATETTAGTGDDRRLSVQNRA